MYPTNIRVTPKRPSSRRCFRQSRRCRHPALLRAVPIFAETLIRFRAPCIHSVAQRTPQPIVFFPIMGSQEAIMGGKRMKTRVLSLALKLLLDKMDHLTRSKWNELHIARYSFNPKFIAFSMFTKSIIVQKSPKPPLDSLLIKLRTMMMVRKYLHWQ